MHLLLSAALGIIFGLAIGVDPSRAFRRTSTILAAIAMLLIVWVINFFVLLPLFHPPFVTLMSLPATLVSKLLFGLTMGWIFHCMAASQTQPDVYRSALETGKAG